MNTPNAWVYFEEQCYLATIVATISLLVEGVALQAEVDLLAGKRRPVQIVCVLLTEEVMALEHWSHCVYLRYKVPFWITGGVDSCPSILRDD
jgi:hypothetical protein